MLLYGLLIAATVASVSDAEVRLQAESCGLKSTQLAWTKDAEGHWRADIVPGPDMDGSTFRSMECLLDWANKSGARVGFVSAPTHATLARATAKSLRSIEIECDLKGGALVMHRSGVWIQNAQDETADHVNCALERLDRAGLSTTTTKRNNRQSRRDPSDE